MEIKSQSRFVRITPRKARLVADAIHNMPLDRALATLDKLHKRAGTYIKKTIESGIANAQQANLSRNHLTIKRMYIDEGPRFKRWRAVSRGMAHPYQKKTSHITVILEEVKNRLSPVKPSDSTRKVSTVRGKSKGQPDKRAADKSARRFQTKMDKKDEKTLSSQHTRKGILTRKVIGG